MNDLIKRLEAWTMAAGDFHSDRQLADEVLIADGWKVIPDATFEGGFRWEWRMPTGGAICSSESTRPHPINGMDSAIGVVPYKAAWTVRVVRNRAQALVWDPERPVDQNGQVAGFSESPKVALVIAALKFKAAHA